MDAVMLWCT